MKRSVSLVLRAPSLFTFWSPWLRLGRHGNGGSVFFFKKKRDIPSAYDYQRAKHIWFNHPDSAERKKRNGVCMIGQQITFTNLRKFRQHYWPAGTAHTADN